MRIKKSILSILALLTFTGNASQPCADQLCAKMKDAGLSPRAYSLMLAQIKQTNYDKDYVAIADYTLPSTRPRFFLINLKTNSFKTYHVSHGAGSGGLDAVRFSNTPGKAQSALGFMETSAKKSSFGEALKLNGRSKSNSRLSTQSPPIIIHCAEYSSQDFSNQYGFWGRSFGCLAVPCEDIHEIVTLLGPKAIVLSYHDQLWDQTESNPMLQEIADHERFPRTTEWERDENFNAKAGGPYMRKYLRSGVSPRNAPSSSDTPQTRR